MAKLLDLLVAAEGFVPVAGRVYAQDGDGWVNPYDNAGGGKGYALPSVSVRGTHISDCGWFALADDYQTAVVTAEAILAARAVRP
jgi:hypothetical protein